MLSDKDIIVAFELGSSAIRGIAGRKEADGSIHILAIEQEKISGSIRRGTVYNINKTTSAIARIKERLNNKLGAYINRAYVGIAGQSLHAVSNRVVRALDAKVQVSQEMIDSLMDENHNMRYPDREILEVAPQEYRLGIDTTSDPIGIQADKIEGRYMNIVARTSLQENIRRCMREAGLDVVELYITPLEEAKALIPESDKRSGCALVDIGAETTTVAIFTKNILRHLVTLPLGSNNINMDIINVHKVEAEEAESLKLKYGTATLQADNNESPRDISISGDRSIKEDELQYLICARTEEIIANVCNQIEKGNWKEDLISGLILTGGGAALKNLPEAFAQYKNFIKANKIRIAKQLLATTPSAADVDNTKPGFNAAISLLMQANEGCTSEAPAPIIEEPELPIVEPEVPEVEEPVAPEPEPETKKKKSWFTGWAEKIKGMVNEDE